jgi:hypothetical protein
MALEDRRALMDQLLLLLGENANKIGNTKLAAFAPMKGHKSNGDLMVIGRALNGWGKGWSVESNLMIESRNNVLKHEFDYSESKTKCPLSWVKELWGNNALVKGEDGESFKYNTKKSAYWRVINRITAELGIDRSADWPSHLMWSNLYKVSPAERGNPNTLLCNLQLDICLKLLKLELSEWHPERILMITGLNYWAQPFIEHLNISPRPELTHNYVEFIGNYIYDSGSVARVVVSKRPERQNESLFTQEVISAFA